MMEKGRVGMMERWRDGERGESAQVSELGIRNDGEME